MKIRNAIIILVALVLANVLVHRFILRWDLTDDKRYSISPATQQLLQSLDKPLEIAILLDGELNPSFTRLKTATGELLEELNVYASKSIAVVEPNIEHVVKEHNLDSIVIFERTHKGQMVQTTIYPYAIVKYGDKQAIVKLLKKQPGLTAEEQLNYSIETLEYEFVEAIRRLKQTKVEKIAFLEGHGELKERDVYELSKALSHYYQIDRGVLGLESGVLDEYKAVIIADPIREFSEEDKYILDQYLMQGGCILWIVNGVRFSQEYLSSEGTTPIIALDLNINDMLFRYGVRVNPALVQDLNCKSITVDVSQNPDQPNWQSMPWTYAPLLLPSQASVITKNIALVHSIFASPINLVGGNDGIKKQVLLTTSTASKFTGVPTEVNLSYGVDDEESYKYANIPVAVSLEGEFTSLYAYLPPPERVEQHAPMLKKSTKTRQIVVSASSTVRNQWYQGQSLPLGYDMDTGIQYGNCDFMVNAVLYLTGNDNWMELRDKTITLRLLNNQRAIKARTMAQVVSIVIPLLVLGLTGGIMLIIRRKKHIRKS